MYLQCQNPCRCWSKLNEIKNGPPQNRATYPSQLQVENYVRGQFIKPGRSLHLPEGGRRTFNLLQNYPNIIDKRDKNKPPREWISYLDLPIKTAQIFRDAIRKRITLRDNWSRSNGFLVIKGKNIVGEVNTFLNTNWTDQLSNIIDKQTT